MKHKIILDCDPGHDDAIAILLAARHPEIDLLAITTVAGNQSLEKTTRNALKVCSLANIRNVPIAMGMDRPLVRPAKHAPDIHGESGMDGPHIPEPTIVIVRLRAAQRPVATFAVDLLVFFADTYHKVFGFPAAPVHDPCAVAAVSDPHILRAHTMHVTIETVGEWTVGRTVCDVYGKLGKEPNARVGYSLEVERFWDMVISTILTYEI